MGWLLAILALSTGGATTPVLDGVWCWGSPRQSARVPFVEIGRTGDGWTIRTKHYMHAYFVGGVRDIKVDGGHVEFTYWYEPRARWAHCAFDADGDRMNGTCDGEIDALSWGAVPSFLWRTRTPGSEGAQERG